VSLSTIPKLIREAIRNDSVLLNLLGTRIHYQTLPQKSIYPHVYYSLQSRDQEDLLDPGEKGLQTNRYVLEVVAEAYNETLITRLQNAIRVIEGTKDGIDIHVVEVADLDDQYEFKSADGDALFLHGFTVEVYYTE
jgi:uncharacterized protein (DUF952 family)